jgi:hypothetical protein
MKIRCIYLAFVLAASLNIICCVSNRNYTKLEKRITYLEEKYASLLQAEKRQKEIIYRNIERDDPALGKKIRKKSKKLKKTKADPHGTQKKEILKLIKAIDRVIEKKYQIFKINFEELNCVKLPKEGINTLEKIKKDFNDLCNSRRKIIIYGFSCFIGPQNKIKEVSYQRAKSVKDWFIKNLECPNYPDIRYKGLGIFFTHEEIKEFPRPLQEHLLGKSRHAKIFLPRK